MRKGPGTHALWIERLWLRLSRAKDRVLQHCPPPRPLCSPRCPLSAPPLLAEHPAPQGSQANAAGSMQLLWNSQLTLSPAPFRSPGDPCLPSRQAQHPTLRPTAEGKASPSPVAPRKVSPADRQAQGRGSWETPGIQSAEYTRTLIHSTICHGSVRLKDNPMS